MTKYVALTGGIGCGKSVVSKVFMSLGVPVYDSDSKAKQLMETNGIIRDSLMKLLGNQIYKGTSLQRKVMADAIFSDASVCKKVNDIVHPQVWLDYKLWSDKKNVPFTIMETALLFESDLYKNFDYSIAVIASDALRVERVVHRDLCTEAEVRRRIKNQSSNENASQKVDFIIENNDTFVLSQVETIYNELRQL